MRLSLKLRGEILLKRKRINRWVVILGIVIFSPIINYGLACLNLSPIFAIPVAHYKDGGTVIYKGIGHTIIHYNELESLNSRDEVVFISFFLNKGEPNIQDKQRWD